MSIRLYVGNLSKDLERQELEAVFAEHSDDIVSVKLISDKKTGKCRGFGFVTVKTDEKADALVEKFNGYVLNDSELKIEKALPRSKGKDEAPESSDNEAPRRRSGPSAKGGGGARKKSTTVSDSTTAAQPDPRWAGELEKLKQLLAAQTTSS
ncbi:MAG TPA: RNA-binding protein [Leptolyngbyaceae cyanobacterium]